MPWKQNAGGRCAPGPSVPSNRLMGGRSVCRQRGLPIHGKPWFWLVMQRGGVQVLHRMVGTMVADVAILKVCAQRQSQLCDPDRCRTSGCRCHRSVRRQWRNRRLRVARAVGQEHAIRFSASTSAGVWSARHHVSAAATLASMRRMLR